MIKNKLIIIPLATPWNWTADYLRQTSLSLAKNHQILIYDQNNAYFFLKKSHKKSYPKIKNITFVQAKFLIPGRRIHLIEKINQQLSFYLLLNKYRKREKIVWFFDPNDAHLSQQKNVKTIKIYDCVDFHTGPNAIKTTQIRKKERELIKNVDFFFVNSKILAKIHRDKKNEIIYLPAQGFKAIKVNKKKEKNNRPKIGFVGGINKRLDFKLLKKLIINNHQWDFLFWGPEQKNNSDINTIPQLTELKKLSNTCWGESDKKEIGRIIQQFDVAIIPYDVKQDFNRYCYPMKLFEYFYFGKPVISTPIEELKDKKFKNFVKIGQNAQEWEKHIKNLLEKSWPEKYQAEQRQLAVDNSWRNKLKKILDVIENVQKI